VKKSSLNHQNLKALEIGKARQMIQYTIQLKKLYILNNLSGISKIKNKKLIMQFLVKLQII
jgi:hypothetical protein